MRHRGRVHGEQEQHAAGPEGRDGTCVQGAQRPRVEPTQEWVRVSQDTAGEVGPAAY